VLQNLPDNALLLTGRNPVSASFQPVECHPSIITMPHVSMTPLHDRAPGTAVPPQATGYRQQGPPELAPRQPQPQWPTASGSPADAQWLPRPQPPVHRRQPPSDRYP